LQQLEEWSVRFPQERPYIEARERVVEGVRQLLQSLAPPEEVDAEEVKKALDISVVAAGPSRNLLYNLSLVMLVTQTEIFIEHLVDVILTVEPRRLKDLAEGKTLTASELVDLADYESVMKRLREKVSKEVVDSSTRDMFLKHLGERFGLFRPEQFVLKYAPGSPKEKEQWGISEIEVVWGTRHEIVHEGQLTVDESLFTSAFVGCSWLETFLSLRAHDTYGISIDNPEFLTGWSKVWSLQGP
jgi:hypothetical protein